MQGTNETAYMAQSSLARLRLHSGQQKGHWALDTARC